MSLPGLKRNALEMSVAVFTVSEMIGTNRHVKPGPSKHLFEIEVIPTRLRGVSSEKRAVTVKKHLHTHLSLEKRSEKERVEKCLVGFGSQ